MSDLDGLMEFASATARGAGRITLEHYGRVSIEYKVDGSEVTAADREAEAFVRSAIAERFPEDGVMGEEDGETPSRSERRWIVDPIDGTRSFSSAVPLYGVLLTLEEDGVPVLGCAHFPVSGDVLVAARGAGAWINGRRARVSDCDDLSRARVVTSGLEYWRDQSSDDHRAGFQRLQQATRFTRTWGDAFGYLLVATGRVDLFVDPICGAYWDYAAMTVIIPEAGGRLTQFDGSPIGDWTSAIASNGVLHEAARQLLVGPQM